MSLAAPTGVPCGTAMAEPSRWRILPLLGVLQIVSWGSSYYLLAVLGARIVADTGWGLPWVLSGLSVGFATAGLVLPKVGATIGRRGGRSMLACASMLFALGLGCLALAPGIWVFLGGWVVLGLAMGMGLYDAAFATLGVLYGKGARRPIQMVTLMVGFSSTICWPLTLMMADAWGWRGACLAYAAWHLLGTLPLVLCLVPGGGSAADMAARARAQNSPLSGQEHVDLRLLMVIQVIIAAVSAVISLQLLMFLQARGLTEAAAVGLGTLLGPMQFTSRLLEMLGGGRRHPIWTMVGACLLICLGLSVMATDLAPLWLAVGLYGAGIGIFSIARGTVALVVFGPERYPVLVGRLGRPAMIAQAMVPTASAWALVLLGVDATLAVLVVLMGGALVAVAILWHRLRLRGDLAMRD